MLSVRVQVIASQGSADYKLMETSGKTNKKKKRREPGCCSQANFLWVYPYLMIGYTKSLTVDKMPPLFSRFESKVRTVEAINHFDKNKEDGALARLKSTFWYQNRFTFNAGLCVSVCQGLLNNLGRPLVLKLVIDAAMPSTSLSFSQAVWVVLLFGAVIFLEGLSTVNVRQILANEVASNILSWLIPLIHQKSMRISSSSGPALKGDKNASSTNESAIIGNDLIRGFSEVKWMCNLPQNVVGFVAGITALALLLGWNCLVGILVMAIVLLINWQVAKCSEKITKQELTATDARIVSLKEVIGGIEQVKFGAWEEPYLNLLEKKRLLETHYILKARRYQIVNMALGRCCPILAGCATFVYMGLTQGDSLTASQVFASLAAYNSLRMPLITLPMNLIQMFTLRVTAQRLASYLDSPEQHRTNTANSGSNAIVQIKDATIGWGKCDGRDSTHRKDGVAESAPEDPGLESFERFVLLNVSLNIERRGTGNLVAIVGQVGSGKSTLINAMIGTNALDAGTVETVESVGYVPQKPFVLSGTILNNILMGRKYDEAKIKEAISASAFLTDLKLMDSGVNTEVGERGTTLSGGQQQRLAIARAAYGDPELLIVDDALASVDGHVANSIFKSICIQRKSKGLTTVVAINQLHFVHKFDHVIFLKGGKIASQGTYQKVFEENEDFRGLIASGEEAEGQDIDQLDEGAPHEAQQAPHELGSNEALTTEASAAKLVKEEKIKKGLVSGREVLMPYYKGLGGHFYPVGALVFAVAAYALMAGSDLWLASWITDMKDISTEENSSRALGYAGLAFLQFLGVLFLSLYNAVSTTKAARLIHKLTITHLMHAPMRWFERTPSGRILSRFSGDLSLVDHVFAFIVDDIWHFFFIIVAFLVVIGLIVPQIVPVLFFATIFYSFEVVSVDRSNREVKRASNNSLGPIMTLVQETVNGRALIHAMKFHSFFSEQMYSHVNEWSRFNYFSATIMNAGTHFVNILAFFISVSAASVVLFNRDDFQNPAMVGVALGYSFLLPYFLGLFALMIQMLLTAATSLERILQYQSDEVPQAPAWHLKRDKELERKDWPSDGNITYEHMSLKYRPELEPAVKDATLTIRAQEKVGVIGRTGAGKSTLMVALFRLCDPCSGKIYVDDEDISNIGLQHLRQNIAIIPQRSLILEGSVRHNLDPFDKHEVQKLSQVLVDVALCKDVKAAETLLRVEIGPNANSGLSAGEQQLLSIARALLQHHVRVVIMDEPTANIDMRTDEMVQRVIRKAFSKSTVITIAHRLNTIIDFDKIVVMDKGSVVEIGAPVDLLDNPDSFLCNMVTAMGKKAAVALRKKAKDAAFHRQEERPDHKNDTSGGSGVEFVADTQVEVVVVREEEYEVKVTDGDDLSAYERRCWLDFVSKCFEAKGTPRTFFEAQLKQLPKHTIMSLVDSTGHCLSTLCIFEVEFREYRTAGIGSVCTSERHRGKGYGSHLLQYSKRFIEESIGSISVCCTLQSQTCSFFTKS